jgi:hypothetical protein
VQEEHSTKLPFLKLGLQLCNPQENEHLTRRKHACTIDFLRGKEPNNIHRNQKLMGAKEC